MTIPTNFQTTLTQFQNSLHARNVSNHTITAYTTDLTQFFTWIAETDLSVTTPAAITRSLIIEYLAALAAKGRSGVTRARKLAAIREYYKFLVAEGMLSVSPATTISMPKKERKTRVFLRVDEYMRLLNAAAGNSRDYAILQVFLQTGIRVAELVGLQISDIDLSEGTMLINGKGNKQRTVYLEKKATQALRAYLAVRPRSSDQHVFLGYDNDAFIFGPFVLLMHLLPLSFPLLLKRASFDEPPSSCASSLVSSCALVVLLVPLVSPAVFSWE